MKKFEVIFLTEAREFLLEMDEKSRDKVIFNIDKAKVKTDNELFKKLKGEIWEFKNEWTQMDSPTNVLLTRVIAHVGKYYAAGVAGSPGLVLPGDEDHARTRKDCFGVGCHHVAGGGGVPEDPARQAARPP